MTIDECGDGKVRGGPPDEGCWFLVRVLSSYFKAGHVSRTNHAQAEKLGNQKINEGVGP
ncbi:hypothetical protein [Sulfidibacter corallicola]|uniref:Uncharacterized protein n=1 Tax=Sulfidibacter corallicola TaxID=2818388 RepID=A0A8A4TQC0_SULCO|nr:hypothetical protein [Sulfidibacter corallicola]QTD51282.1 hypothetical protein J3U87_02340 [Sulfidibacter corallicola]